jgi:hypothetical protein
LDYDLGDLHTPYPNIEEDMEFTKVLIVKKKLEENFALNTKTAKVLHISRML